MAASARDDAASWQRCARRLPGLAFCHCKVVSQSFTEQRFFRDAPGCFEAVLIFAAVFCGGEKKSLAGLGFVEYK